MTRAPTRQLNPDRMAVNNGRVTSARMGLPGFLIGVAHDPDDQEWHRDLDFNVYREVSIWPRAANVSGICRPGELLGSRRAK